MLSSGQNEFKFGINQKAFELIENILIKKGVDKEKKFI